MEVGVARQPDLTEKIWGDLRRFLGTSDDEFFDSYGEIRRKLVRIFQWRGASDPEQLADDTIFRVAQKCGEIVDSYVGDPVLYFCGFARRVFLESIRNPAPSLPPPPEPSDQEKLEDELKKEAMHECLDECMTEKLSSDKRQMILDYYRGEAASKIRHRKKLAEELGKSTNALRIKAHRIRAKLQDCVFDCVQSKGFE